MQKMEEVKKMDRRYTLAEMKAISNANPNSHFFDRDTMKFFRGDKYRTRYDSETGQNYLIVEHPASRGGGVSWHRFYPKGKNGQNLGPCSMATVPDRVKNKHVQRKQKPCGCRSR